MTALDTLKNLAGRLFGSGGGNPLGSAGPPPPVPSSLDAVPEPATSAEPAAAPSASAPEPPPGMPEAPPADFQPHHARERDEDAEPDPDRALVDAIVEAVRQVYDPEIPVNVYDIGLIYDIKIDEEKGVDVDMTLTSPMCPVAGTLPPEVEQKVAGVEGVTRAKVEITWDPPWHPDMMSEGAKLELGML